MINTDFQNKMNEIQTKLGAENSAPILDDIGLLITDNQTMNNELDNKNTEIQRQKAMIETLQKVNANLLQQVSAGEDPDINKKPPEEQNKEFDFRTVFDENGNFKK